MSEHSKILLSNDTPTSSSENNEVDIYAFPASYGQKQLWFLNQIDPDSAVYNVPFALKLKGELDVSSLKKSIIDIITRHETFRTTFSFRNNELTQFITSHATIPLSLIDLSDLDYSEEGVLNKIKEFTLKPFDLEKGPLIRTGLVKLNNFAYIIMLSFHHTIIDHTSVQLFFNELSSLYNCYLNNNTPDLPTPSLQYADVVIWQNDKEQEKLFQTKLNYWKDQFKYQEGILNLPLDNPRPDKQTFIGVEKKVCFHEELSNKLRDLGKREKKSLFTVLLSAYKILLYRYTNEPDIIVGTPFANRTQPGMEDVMGCCMNTLPLRTNISSEDSFLSVLDKVREVTLGAQANQEISFEQIVEEVQPERDAGYNPLFQVSFMFQQPISSISFNGIESHIIDIQTNTSKFDITLWMWDESDGFKGLIQYNTKLFKEETIDRLVQNFSILLEEITSYPGKKISELEILSNNEKNKLFNDWNKTDSNYPKEVCIHQLVENTASRYPNNIAVEFDNKKITYKRLNDRAEDLANYLISTGVKPGSLIGICLDRSIDMIVGLLGILKTGSAYVPLDPTFPVDRLSYMMDDSKISTLITQSKYSDLFPKYNGRKVCLDLELPKVNNNVKDSSKVKFNSANIVYVIYTSGSTGQPKGVRIRHSSFVNFLYSMKVKPGFNDNDVLLSVTTLSFDIAGLEIFLPLICGGKVIIVSKENSLNGQALVKIIERKNVTVMQATPATFRLMISSGWEKKIDIKLLCGGERLPVDLAEKLLQYSNELWNMYGPTETTIWSTIKKIVDINSINIGRPIANTVTYILDKNLKPVPIGAKGELYIGGDGLAKGYLNRPDLTEQTFLPNPFLGEPEEMIYKTGDLVRYKSNGEIEYIGRIDNQLKVRGFRIEPDEIESVLSGHNMIKQSLVTSFKDNEGTNRLVAYLKAEEENFENVGALINEHISDWQLIWNETYLKSDSQLNPELNILGWTSSYTDEAFSEKEMLEWLNNTINNIMEYKPRNILEIGCGSGLLLFKLAPLCENYTGLDFSSNILNRLQKIVRSKKLSNVNLFCQTADDLSNIGEGIFDTIVINSVIQYFPGINYLQTVIKKSLSVLKPGGQIFIGDVRNLQLLKIFAMSVELEKSGNKISSTELLNRINKRISEEEELVIDPDFFLELQKHLPEVTDVKILFKKGEYLNELTKYRYDVVLCKGEPTQMRSISEWIDYSDFERGKDDLSIILKDNSNKSIGIRNIPNSRIVNETKTFDYINNNEIQSLASLNNDPELKFDNYHSPADFIKLGNKYNYKTHMVYSTNGPKDKFDLVYYRDNIRNIKFIDTIVFPNSNLNSFTNNPLAPKFKYTLLPNLKEYLKSKLPEYMIPSSFIFLKEMPLTPNKKIDRKKLPQPIFTSKTVRGYIPPRDETEIKLASIWKTTLGINKIGINESFFDLGGHSLLAAQLFAKIEKKFDISIPLAALFQAQTIESLANIIRQKEWKSEWKSLVPIKSSGSKTPLFLVHGAEGNVLLYRELANYLGEDQPIYGLQSKGIEGTEEIITTFEEMAEHYVKEICELQPKGPYFLGGYCLGGAIAYQMAKQLNAKGEKVALLALLETYNIKSNCNLLPIHYKIYHKFQNLYYHFRNVMEAKTTDKRKFIKEKINIEFSRLKVKWNIAFNKLYMFFKPGKSLKYHHLMIDKINDKAQENFEPTKYYGKVVLYKPKGRFKGYSDTNFGWSHLVNEELKVVNLPFYLRGMLVEPFVKILAKKLIEDINEANKEMNIVSNGSNF